MTKASTDLQDLRRRIYVKAKAEPSWRFWGLYVHVCKRETLRESYRMAKKNNGAPGIDGVTFDAIEGRGVEVFLGELHAELISGQYRPMRNPYGPFIGSVAGQSERRRRREYWSCERGAKTYAA